MLSLVAWCEASFKSIVVLQCQHFAVAGYERGTLWSFCLFCLLRLDHFITLVCHVFSSKKTRNSSPWKQHNDSKCSLTLKMEIEFRKRPNDLALRALNAFQNGSIRMKRKVLQVFICREELAQNKLYWNKKQTGPWWWLSRLRSRSRDLRFTVWIPSTKMNISLQIVF